MSVEPASEIARPASRVGSADLLAARTFDGLCADMNATAAERRALALHLAGMRFAKTLELADPPRARSAKRGLRTHECSQRLGPGSQTECPVCSQRLGPQAANAELSNAPRTDGK